MQKSNKISKYIYIDLKVYYAVTLTLASEIDCYTNFKFHRPTLFRAAAFFASKLAWKLYIPSELKIINYLIITFTSSVKPRLLLF